jgi:hypothetical protein
MSKSEKDFLLRDCRCCPDYFDACMKYVPGMHRRYIREIFAVFKEHSKNFDKENYEIFLKDIAKVLKLANIYFLEEKFIKMTMEED